MAYMVTAGGETSTTASASSTAASTSSTAGIACGIEHIPELHAMGLKNAQRDPIASRLLTSGAMSLSVVDGFKGLPEKGPYHAIHVGAAAPTIPPALVEQLAPGGRMIIPVGPESGSQHLYQIDKGMDGKVMKKSMMGVRYVPLCTKPHQLSRA